MSGLGSIPLETCSLHILCLLLIICFLCMFLFILVDAVDVFFNYYTVIALIMEERYWYIFCFWVCQYWCWFILFLVSVKIFLLCSYLYFMLNWDYFVLFVMILTLVLSSHSFSYVLGILHPVYKQKKLYIAVWSTSFINGLRC